MFCMHRHVLNQLVSYTYMFSSGKIRTYPGIKCVHNWEHIVLITAKLVWICVWHLEENPVRRFYLHHGIGQFHRLDCWLLVFFCIWYRLFGVTIGSTHLPTAFQYHYNLYPLQVGGEACQEGSWRKQQSHGGGKNTFRRENPLTQTHCIHRVILSELCTLGVFGPWLSRLGS